MSDIFLETERMTLRRFTTADVDHLFELDSDPEVMRPLNGGLATPREVIELKMLPAFLRSYHPVTGLGIFAAIERQSGTFLGRFSFRTTEENSGPDEVSLGYRLRRAAWNQGYATEGVRALLRKGFTELGVVRVVATAYQDNLASCRVLEKAGLKLVRRYRMTMAEMLSQGVNAHTPSEALWDGDDIEYGLLKTEWEQQQPIVKPS